MTGGDTTPDSSGGGWALGILLVLALFLVLGLALTPSMLEGGAIGSSVLK